MDFTNDTDRCIALTVGEDGAPPIDAANVWAHRRQHFDDNHTNVVVHANVYERDCAGRIVAAVHDRIHQLRNILTLTQTGSEYTLRRQAIPDVGVTTGPGEIAPAPSAQTGAENFQAGPAYRVRPFAVANVHLGDDARAVRAIAATGTGQRVGRREIAFTARDGGAVTVELRDGTRASEVRYRAGTPTPRKAAAFARAALERYGWKPTTQVSGPFIGLQYCAIARGTTPVACDRAAPMLEVRGAVPQSTIELRSP